MQKDQRLPMENYIGCLVGGAVGDALGAPIEFMSWPQIKYIYGDRGITGYVEFPDGHGEFTDDTQMTLFTGEAVLRSITRASHKGIWGAIQLIAFHTYKKWLETQGIPYDDDTDFDQKSWLLDVKGLHKRRAPGNTCVSSLQEEECGTMDAPKNNSKGCGGVMRVAPAGLVFWNDLEFAFENGSLLAAITHGHPSGYLSAGYFAALIAGIASGMAIERAALKSLKILKYHKYSQECAQIIEKAVKLSKTQMPTPELIETLGSGWVGEEAIAISVYCALYYKNDFAGGVLSAVNHSGDCDSTGAITGNILGLVNGMSKIPVTWVKNLSLVDVVTEMAKDLRFEVSEVLKSEKWWNKYKA